jgi:hypothetical protein
MSHNEELTKNRSKFIVSAVALVFCLVWALIGEADVKIVAVSISFIAFLKYGIATEMSYLAGHGSH